MWTCRLLPATEWPSLAAFIHRHNQRPDGRRRCLHAEQGDTDAEHAQELRELPAGEAVFVAAEAPAPPGAEPERVGMAGAEFDPVRGRAWVRGPLLSAPAAPGAEALHRQLVAHLLAALPGIARFDAFPSADEAPLLAAYADAGFVPQQVHHVMRGDRLPPAEPDSAAPRIHELHAGDALLASVVMLHDQVFPDTYLPGPALAASLDDDHRLFATQSDGAVTGYVYVKQQRVVNDAYIDYLGVAEATRGRGLGRALLAAALRWAIAERALPCVHLTVRQDRAPALGLYEAAGFREVAAGLQCTLQRAAASHLAGPVAAHALADAADDPAATPPQPSARAGS